MRRLIIILLVGIFLFSMAGTALADNRVHIVAPGDTLSRIAAYYGVSAQAIAAANGIYNPNRIYVGQTLVIPYGSPVPPYTPPYTPPPYTPPAYPPHGANTYYVRPGDTLGSIAAYFRSTIQAIASANGIYNPNVIYVGQRLVIPYVPVIYHYHVQRGDTLASIARRYGTTVQAIASYNGLHNPNLIYPGMRLSIPV